MLYIVGRSRGGLVRRSLVLLVLPILLTSCSRPPSLSIQEIAHYDTPGWAHDVSLEQDKAYISDREGGYIVFDRPWKLRNFISVKPVRDVISLAPNCGNPVLASRFEGIVALSPSGQISDCYSNGDIANAVEVRGDLAFAAYGLHGLVIARLTNGRVRAIATLPTKGWSHDLRLTRNQALLADWKYGLRVVDISNPENPAEIASLPGPATTISLAVQESGDGRLIALAEGHAGIALATLDSNGRPILLSRHFLGLNPADIIHPETGGWVHSVAWAGLYLFAANWKRGLTVLDVHGLKNPRLLQEIPTEGTALGVKTSRQPDGSYLVFLAEGESGLRIFRFRDK
jgi:hypothetical protein